MSLGGPRRNGQADYDSDDPQNQSFNPAINRIPRARPDELQGLLADPEDTDVDAERMSLHSNPGAARRGKKKRRTKKKYSNSDGNPRRITLFGYNLFGRGVAPPIHLPEDEEDALYAGPSSHRQRKISTTSTSTTDSGSSPNPSQTLLTAHSTATFDSDAAPLDVETIAALSSPDKAAAAIEAAQAAAAAQAALEAERKREREEKEERRRRRRERKEMKRVAEALAAEQQQNEGGADGEFEGFQGGVADMIPPPINATSKTGSGYPRIPNSMYPGAPSDSGSEGFGRFVTAGPPSVLPPPPTEHTNPLSHADDEDDAADLDGGLYARKAPRDGGALGSDSRSRTSASTSDRGAQMFPDPRNVLKQMHAHSQSHSSRSQQSHARSASLSQSSSSRMNSPSPYQTQFQANDNNNTPSPSAFDKTKKSKSSKSSSSRTTQSRSSTTTSSQSPSLPSPVSPTFTGIPDGNGLHAPQKHVEQGLGFFDLEDEALLKERAAKKASGGSTGTANVEQRSDFPAARIGGGFPMTGFGGGGAAGGRKTRDFGAFLARRGDDGDEDGGDGL